MKGLTNLLMN